MLLFFNGVNGEAIYRKTSPLTGKLNHEIFDKRITIYDDGTINGAFNSCPFDDEGIMSQKTLLVEKGFLKNFLTDIEYSGKLNMAPTGNGFRTKGMMSAYRSYKMYPAIRPSTMVMEPGTTSEADLISNIKKGVLIKNIKDFPVDPNGDFSGVSERAYKIVNGKITGRVKNLKIRGNIYNLFKDKLLAISSDVEISEEFRLPYMLFKDVEIMC
jgi:PmbA protein